MPLMYAIGPRAFQTCDPPGGCVNLDGKYYDIAAQVHTIGGYSLHADQKDMAGFVTRMRKWPSDTMDCAWYIRRPAPACTAHGPGECSKPETNPWIGDTEKMPGTFRGPRLPRASAFPGPGRALASAGGYEIDADMDTDINMASMAAILPRPFELMDRLEVDRLERILQLARSNQLQTGAGRRSGGRRTDMVVGQ